MAHKVNMLTPEQQLENAPVKFWVYHNNKLRGRIEINKTKIEWFQKGKHSGVMMRWDKFAALMEESGKK